MVIEFLAEGVQEGIRQEASLLLMAFTNRAVDEICQMLGTIEPEPTYVRIGPELSADPAYRHRTLSALAQQHPTRQGIRGVLASTPIVVGTIASIAASQELFLLKRFQTAIVDEASQVLEPQLLPLLCAQSGGQVTIRKFIFIGDHKQLPAVVAQSEQYSRVEDPQLQSIGLMDCRQSLFERLHRLVLAQYNHDILGMLQRQGRMHIAISSFVSRNYYGGQLDIVPLPHQTGKLHWTRTDDCDELQALLSHHRLLHFDVASPSEAGQKSNSAEAELAARIVNALARLCQLSEQPLDWTHRLGIIVPFRSQIQQLRSRLAALQVPEYPEITIDTVERFQGSQRDIIIFSTVVGATWQLPILSAPIETEGLFIDRKLNVALTRARKQFVLIGNETLLRTSRPYREVLEYIKSCQDA